MATRNSKAGTPAATQALTAADVPVTCAMLGGVRTELLERIDQARGEAKADAQKLDHKIDVVRAELKDVKTELKNDLHGLKAQLARMEVLMEEQNTRNKIVLDGLTAVLSRQERFEERLSDVEGTVRSLATARPVVEQT